MTIQLKCPNGHTLTADDSHAGKTGTCPACRSSVIIPPPKKAVISESAVVRILGCPNPMKQFSAKSEPLIPASDATMEKTKTVIERPAETLDSPHPNFRRCPSCERDVDTRYRLCPHCQTYFT